jgi:hypothetical protein
MDDKQHPIDVDLDRDEREDFAEFYRLGRQDGDRGASVSAR